MGVVQEVIRYIFIRAKADGVDQTTASLKKLGEAEAQVTVKTTDVGKAALSTENALDRLRRSIDSEYRSQQSLAKATDVLQRSRVQGLITAAEEARLLELATTRHSGLAHGAGAATSQIMALTHVARSMTEQIAMGVPVTQALTAQFSHLSYIAGAPGGLMGAFRGLAALLAPMAVPLLAIGTAVAAIGVGFAALTTKINESAKTHVSFGNVVVATFQVAAGAIGKFFKPAIDQLGTWWKQFVDWLAPLFKNAVNGIIGTFVGAFNTIKDTWSLLPAAFASIFTKAMNGAIDIVQNGINGIIEPINGLLSAVNLPTLGKADLSGFKGTPSNADNDIAGIAGKDFGAAYGVDYAGQAFGAISDQAQKLALANLAAENSAKSLGKTLSGPLSLGIDKLTETTNAWVDAAKSAFSNLGTTIIQAFTKGGNVVNNLLDSLGQKLGQFGENVANSAFNQLLNIGLKALTAGLTGGIGGGSSFVGSGFGSYGKFANGGVLSSPGLSTYSGTIVDRPTVFPFAKGAGLMGEAGPEAVMPLRRGSDGKLGVAANGNSGGVVINFHNVSKADIPDLNRWASQELTPKLQRAQRHPHRKTL